MRESSIVPTNLLNWPRVEDLLPEQKLILLAIWASPWLSCAGSGELPLRLFAASLGLSSSATETGLQNLVDAGLVLRDADTGEVCVLDWFRFHSFKSAKQLSNLISAINKVRSERLRSVILQKSSTWRSTETTTATITKTSSPPAEVEGVVAQVEEYLEAAEAEALRAGTPIRSKAGWAHAIRQRVSAQGLTAEDRELVERYRARPLQQQPSAADVHTSTAEGVAAGLAQVAALKKQLLGGDKKCQNT